MLWRPPRRLVAVALAFAAGALISTVSFELFEESYNSGGAWRAGLGFAAGATVFAVTDALLDRITAANPTGLALLAGVTLDGVPENVALGVSLNAAGSVALLVAVFASNFPEALAGAVSMRQQGWPRGSVVALWGGATCGAAPRCSPVGWSSPARHPNSWPCPWPSRAAQYWRR
ncbi:MAG: ZIP family metal transporter [Pseudonocardiaceae bacterium]